MATTDTATGIGRIANYRNWVAAGSRRFQIGLSAAVLVLLLVVGLLEGTLHAAGGSVLSLIVSWVVLLFALYTWYAVGRSMLGR